MDEQQSIVVASDGTRLFVRSNDAGYPPGTVRAILSDGIICDGVLWKYLCGCAHM